MRITGGEFGGRNLKVPKSDAIRPTQDRVREAVFNIIQFEVAGSDFLDLFAGSGAVGLEAFSRGARSVTFVEANRRHLSVLKENLTLLCSTSTSDFASLVSADAYRWISTYAGPGFSIGFAVCARGREGLCASAGDAGGAGSDSSERPLHRRDDGGAEGGGDARLGAGARPHLWQDENLHVEEVGCVMNETFRCTIHESSELFKYKGMLRGLVEVLCGAFLLVVVWICDKRRMK